MAETWRLRLYDDDGTTIAAEFSTDPTHARPYLVVPDQLATQTVDLIHGRASIGGCNIEIVDVVTVPGDQDTGYMTSKLAGIDGQTARIGRRAHLEILVGGVYKNVINGVVDDVELHDSYSSFTLSIKDQRENERRTRAFVRADTSSIFPRGVIAGWGQNPDGTWLIPPVTPVQAVYRETNDGGTIVAGLDFPFRADRVPVWQILTAKMKAALNSLAQDDKGRQYHNRVKLYWRPLGGGAFNEFDNLLFTVSDQIIADFSGPGVGRGTGTFKKPSGGEVINVEYLNGFFWAWPSEGEPHPIDNATIEVILGYNGPPSEDYPLHLEGLTFGELLGKLYDGDYSDEGTPQLVLYDPAQLALLNEPVFGRITAPLIDDDGIWKFVEQQIMAPLGAAPALDDAGLVSPVRDRLPDIALSLLELNDAICEPVPGWSHTGKDAVNIVDVFYPRFYAMPADRDPLQQDSDGDGVYEVRQPVKRWLISSIALLGERPLTIEANLLGAIGGAIGDPITGDVLDEMGSQLANRRAQEALDRFALGGQHFRKRIRRTDLGARRVGDWCIVATSWTPEYTTGQRGANRVAQIVEIAPIDSVWVELELIDGGPDVQPVGQPTLGSLTVDADGVVSIPVTALAAGSEARVEYAVADVQPAADSALWRFAGRVDTVPTTVKTPPNPSASTVWVRARGEQTGRRPSAWTNVVSIAVPATPRVRNVRLTIDQDTGAATVTWEPNALALGIRLHWDAHTQGQAPGTMATVDVAAAALTYTWPDGTVTPGQMLTVDVEPYPGWTGSAVSGTPGRKVRVTDAMFDTEDIALGTANFREIARTETSITYGWIRGADVNTIWVYDLLRKNPPPTEPWPGVTDLPTVILPVGVDTYTVQIPPQGYLRYLQFEPRGAPPDLAVGPIDRVVVTPTLDPPDQIVSLEAIVNDEDGSVTVRVYVVDRTRSYRYAYNVGVDPAWPTDAEVEGGTVRTVTGSDGFVLPAGTVNWNETIRIRAAPYVETTGLGFEGAADHGSIRSAEDIRLKPPVELEVTHESESGATGSFGVTLRDGSGVSVELFVRTKSGHNAFSAWASKTASPTDGVEYLDTVPLIEDHPSFIEYRLDYIFNGALLSLHAKSSALDRGQIPNGVVKPVLDETNDTASADLVGDFDTASWKIVASTAGIPSDATVRAATAVNGRIIRATTLGALLTALTMGQRVYFKAFAYSGAGGTGNESSAAITAEAVYKVAAPILEGTTATEVAGVATHGVTVRDAAGQADSLWYRKKTGTGAYGAWTAKTMSPTDNTEYQETVTLVEDHVSHIQWRLDYVLAGDPQSVTLESPAFDRGLVPDGSLIPTISESGGADVIGKGDFDTLSWKFAASTSTYPADATVRAATAINGRVAFASNLLGTGVLPGQRVYYKAFAYSQAGGAGTESSTPITAVLDRGTAVMPKIQADAVRSGTTVTATLTIRDESLRVTNVEFNKRDGAHPQTTTGWVTSWDGSTGTIGSSRDLVRSEAVSVPDGKDAEFRYRVTFTDEMGVSRIVEDTIPVSNLQAITKDPLMFGHTLFISQRPESEIMRYNTIYAFPVAASGSVLAQASIVLPKGVTITGATMRMYKSGGTCTVQAIFGRVNRASSSYTNLMAVTHGGSGWEDLSASLSELVGNDPYTAIASFVNVNSEDVRIAWFEITYTTPSYAKSY